MNNPLNPQSPIDNIKIEQPSNEKNSPEINASWIEHAYPLKRISIVAQATRHGTRESLIRQKEMALKLLKEGFSNGCEHDDDFGFLFKTEEDLHVSIFGDDPAGRRHQ